MSQLLPDLNAPLDELESFSNVGIIITDLDGTFVKQDGDILGQLKGIQSQFSHNAITVTIATGRTYMGVKEIANQMKIKQGTPLALYNGAVVLAYHTNNILFQETIPFSVLQELCTFINWEQQYILAYCISGNGQNIIETVHGFGLRTLEKDVNGMEILWHTRDDLENLNFEGSLFSQDYEPCSILIDWKLLGNQEKNVSRYLEQCPLVSCTSSGSIFWEVRARGVNKGVIFKHFKHNVKCIAIGDNDNDIELLQNADIGVAVANSSSAAKAVAQYLCREAGASGVLELVRTIKEANRYFG